MTNEERVADVEIRLASQEDLIDTLNKTVFRQQQKIDELNGLCMALARRLKEIATTLPDQSPLNERPPHY